MRTDSPVLFYDGDCGLCNRSVRFILGHEKDDTLSFATLQSDFAREMLKRHDYDFSAPSTFVLMIDGQVYYKSEAAMRVLKFISWPYRWLGIFRIVPRSIRDRVYDWVSRNRHKWFRSDRCVVPDAETRRRFIA